MHCVDFCTSTDAFGHALVIQIFFLCVYIYIYIYVYIYICMYMNICLHVWAGAPLGARFNAPMGLKVPHTQPAYMSTHTHKTCYQSLNKLQHTATHLPTLQHTLQHTANTSHSTCIHVDIYSHYMQTHVSAHCITLQHIVPHCNTLCNTLQVGQTRLDIF